MNLKKEVGITIKSKETSNNLKPVRNIYATIMCQSVTVNSNTGIQTHIQIMHSLAHLQVLLPTLAGVVTHMFYTSQSSN